jgi:transitional endoplasmic reticulum ATPase
MIYVPDPNEKARLEIFKIYTKEMPLTKDVDLTQLAADAKNYSGADINAICREAALNALRKDTDSKSVSLADFKEALTKIGPTITPDMESWYKGFLKKAWRVERPATPVA